LLDENIVFFSPVVQTPQCGKQDAMLYLTGAFKVFFNESHRYTREFVAEREAVLEFEAEMAIG